MLVLDMRQLAFILELIHAFSSEVHLWVNFFESPILDVLYFLVNLSLPLADPLL